MNNILSSLVEDHYDNYVIALNHIREICQEIILSGLWRSGFFNSMAFHGGTSLRIFHGLNRFSEDLDFCQIGERYPDMDFATKSVETEFQSLGLDFQMIPRKKRSNNITGYFVEGNALKTIGAFGLPDSISNAVVVNTKIRIKIDIDMNTPDGYNVIHEYKTTPFNYGVSILDKSSLFAAKTSAVISRHWKNRIKGRDLFDFEWYINNNTPINTNFLVNNLRREGLLNEESTKDDILEVFKRRFESIDYDSALSDIRIYVDLNNIPQNWSSDHFIGLAKKIVFI